MRGNEYACRCRRRPVPGPGTLGMYFVWRSVRSRNDRKSARGPSSQNFAGMANSDLAVREMQAREDKIFGQVLSVQWKIPDKDRQASCCGCGESHRIGRGRTQSGMARTNLQVLPLSCMRFSFDQFDISKTIS